MSWYMFRPYVSVGQRRANAAREVAKRQKKGATVSPVTIEGRTIAHTFWGMAWCENLESYSDFSNRLPRGRTYVRNGSVVDLQVKPGKVTALVSGSSLYDVTVTITPLPTRIWKSVKGACCGQIGSLVELLQGRLSRHVMDVVTRRDGGLFPKPVEIEMRCSCPDWAGMCKHVAATLYGIGARLDRQPDLLFLLRRVDHLELIETAGPSAAVPTKSTRKTKTLAATDVADVFGIELADARRAEEARPEEEPRAKRPRRPAIAVAAGKPRPRKSAALPAPERPPIKARTRPKPR
jgi:uncharacterized Zn finger protein